MASEYKKRGGSYTTDKKSESQKHLTQWTKEEWQTKEGSANAKQEDGTEKRYLPKKAWEQMTESEKQATEEKKLEGSREGKQYVENTPKAKKARKNATEDAGDNDEGEDASGADKEESISEGNQSGANGGENDDDGSNEVQKKSPKNTLRGQKRRRAAESEDPKETESKNISDNRPSKTHKNTSGSKRADTEAHAPAGSLDRLPKKGQSVHWRSLGRFLSGKVVEVSYENKEVQGKKVKGSTSDPRVVIESEHGKIAVHKPDACFFDDA